jgi:hypothetical protein
MTQPSGEELLAGFTEELARIQAIAETVQERVQKATATAAAPDGAATVTVGPGGALMNLKFGSRAYSRSPEQLASLVMQLIGKAQAQVGGDMRTAFGELVGDDPQAMDVLTQFLPTDPNAEPQDSGEWPPAQPAEETPEPSPSPATPPAPSAEARRTGGTGARRPSGPRSEEDDEGFNNPW